MNYKRIIEEALLKNEQQLKKLQTFKVNVDGKLYICYDKSNKSRFYHAIYNDNSKKVERKFIPKKKNLDLARRLMQKEYNQRLSGILKQEQQVLHSLHSFDPNSKYALYDSLSKEEKALLKNHLQSPMEFSKIWEEAPYEKYMEYSQNLVFITDKGDLVRSKSEAIIANQLFKNNDILCYKYELALELDNGQILHPDFTIMNRMTGKISYWEHNGMMDNPNYANKFVAIDTAYRNSEIISGENLIYTFESEKYPLDMAIVKSEIERVREGF